MMQKPNAKLFYETLTKSSRYAIALGLTSTRRQKLDIDGFKNLSIDTKPK